MAKKEKVAKKITSATLTSHLHRRLKEGVFIMSAALALFILLSMITYHQADWSQQGLSLRAVNLGGRAGAVIAWSLLAFLGSIAFIFPFILIYVALLYLSYKPDKTNRVDGKPWLVGWKIFVLKTIGLILFIISACALAALLVPFKHTTLPYGTGGFIGVEVALGLTKWFNPDGTGLILLAFFCVGLTLFTGLSWLNLTDKLGQIVLYFVLRMTQIGKNIIQNVIDRYRLRQKKRQKTQLAKPLKVEHATSLSLPKSFPSSKQAPTPSSLPQTFSRVNSTPANLKKTVDNKIVTGSLPSLNLLDEVKNQENQGYSHEQLESMSREVEARLKDFGITVQVVAVHPGPVITRFEMQLAPGVKVSRISGLAKDLARSLSVVSVRVVEVIPGRPVVGLELPNENREMVYLTEILSSSRYVESHSPLTLALGKDISGEPVIADLAKMPHLLVAGTTGSGKSVGVNAMLMGLLFKSTPEEIRLILVDPKMLELSIYEGIPHLLTPVVTDMKEAANALRWSVAEMERRYRLMSEMGVRNLAGFNKKIKHAVNQNQPIADPFWRGPEGESPPSLKPLPAIVIVIDEFADMMMVVGKKVEQLIARIAQKARAAGIHLILATQRPSVDVITGLIKANVPSRIAFQVSSKIDSRTVLDQGGAEQLLGHGDMLYLPAGSSVPTRIHGAFVSDEEVHRAVDDWKKRGNPEYINEILSGEDKNGEGGNSSIGMDGDNYSDKDELYDQAVYIVTKARKASISGIQRRLKIGYNRAARLVEQMEEQGIVTPMEANGSREVIAPPPVED